MRHETGAGLGIPEPRGARVGVIYIAPEDTRQAVLTAILAEDKLKREKIALNLPKQNKAFQRPEDFEYLKMLRRKLQAELTIVTPPGPGLADFARQRRFAVFSTMESFVRSFTTASSSQPGRSAPAPSQPNNKAGKKGFFAGAKKAAPIAAAGAAGFAAGEAAGTARETTPQSKHRGLTPTSDITNLPTESVPQKPGKSSRPTPLSSKRPRPQVADEDTPLKPASIEAADTVDEHDDEDKAGQHDAEAATGVEAGLPAADFVRRPTPRGKKGKPASNIDDHDDWDALPPVPGQPTSSKSPNTTTGAGSAGAKTASPPGAASRPPTSATEPNPIELPMPKGTARTTKPKTTKKLPRSATGGLATQTAPPPVPVATPSTAPHRNGDKVAAAAAVGAVAGAIAAEAVTRTGHAGQAQGTAATGTVTGKTPAVATPTTSRGGTRPPMRNLSSIGPGWAPPGGPMGPGRTPPKRRRAVIIVALVILTLLVIGGLAVSAHPNIIGNAFGGNLPATITITPTSQTVQETYGISGVTSNANADNRQVTVRQLNATKSDTKQVNATGHFHQDAKSASGTITFFNSSGTTQTVASGIMFQVGNIQIVTDQRADIPAAASVSQPGQTNPIPAHAVQTGTTGNIAALAISVFPCCGSSSIEAQNRSAFTGGQGAIDYNFLKQEDVNGAANADQGTLKSNVQNDINGQKKPGEQLLGDLNCQDPNTKSDQPVGPQGSNVNSANITVSMTCNANAFDNAAMQTIAQNLLKQKVSKDPALGAGYVLAGNIVTQPQQPQTQQDGSILFQVVARGIWYYQWTDANKQALLTKIKGMSKAQAQAILNSYAGVGKATIDINNGGNTLPSDLKQIKLDVNTVNGLSGSNQTFPGGSGGNTPPAGSQPSPTPVNGKE